MDRFMGNRSHYHDSVYNTNRGSGPYAEAFMATQNGSISATSSESSLTSGLSDVHASTTAASGVIAWRRFGGPSDATGPFDVPSQDWDESQSGLDDLAIYGRQSTGRWPRLGYHAADVNTHGYEANGRFESVTSPLLADRHSPDSQDSDSPVFYSLAPIQTTGCNSVCPNCWAETQPSANVNMTMQQQQPTSQCARTSHHSDATISGPAYRFGQYLEQQTPTKMNRASSIAHTGFPALVLTRNGSSERSGNYYGPLDDRSSMNGDSEYQGPGSPDSPTSDMEPSGDVRAVNLVSYDQSPIRSWI